MRPEIRASGGPAGEKSQLEDHFLYRQTLPSSRQAGRDSVGRFSGAAGLSSKQTEIHEACGSRVSAQTRLPLPTVGNSSDSNLLWSVRIYFNIKQRENIIKVKGLPSFATMSE